MKCVYLREMSYEISESVKLVCEAIQERCCKPIIFDHYSLKVLLQNLPPLEQLLVARFFCKSPWNIGSLAVLAILQEANVLTASNYILSFESIVEVQLILNDFLEAEFELIKELFVVAHYDAINAIILNDILDECLSSLFTDLQHNPQLNDLQYLKIITKNVPTDFLLSVMQRHLRIALGLHSSNAKTAFANFSNWINEGVDNIKFTKELFSNLLCRSEQETISYLFKLSAAEHFNGWKFYLILLQTIASKCTPEAVAYIRRYYKSRLDQIAITHSLDAMLHLLLSVRATTATSIDIDKNITAYADWYKLYICDMKFVLKVEEFQAIIELLEQCIPYEIAEDYIEIHATFSISPPVHCGKLVQSYKSKCKVQLAKIKAQKKSGKDNDESILIENSD